MKPVRLNRLPDGGDVLVQIAAGGAELVAHGLARCRLHLGRQAGPGRFVEDDQLRVHDVASQHDQLVDAAVQLERVERSKGAYSEPLPARRKGLDS